MKVLPVLTCIITACVVAVSAFMIYPYPPMLDENLHVNRMQKYAAGQNGFTTQLAMLPGYHILLGIPLSFAPPVTLAKARIATTAVSIIFLFACLQILLELDNTRVWVSFAGIAFFPLLFPYYLLVFSDIAATLWLVVSYLFILRKRYMWAGVFASVSVVFRQSNLIWLCFLWYTALYSIHGKTFPDVGRIIRTFLTRLWTFIPGAIGVGIFAVWNQGLAWGGSKQFQHVDFNLTNAALAFALLFLLQLPEYLPLLLQKFPALIRYSSSGVRHGFFYRERWKFCAFIFMTGLALFPFLFSVTHPWNLSWFLLRNRLLWYFSQSILHKELLFVLAFAGALVLLLSQYRTRQPVTAALHLCGIVSLAVNWLIEPRYAIPYVTFLFLTRKPYTTLLPIGNLVVFALVNAYQIQGMTSSTFFP